MSIQQTPSQGTKKTHETPIFTALSWIRGLDDLTKTERNLMFTLASYSNRNHEAWPSQETLAADCNLSKRTVIRTTQSLEQKGYIRITPMKRQGQNAYNKYTLLLTENEQGDIAVSPSKVTFLTSKVTQLCHPKSHLEEPVEETIEISVEKKGKPEGLQKENNEIEKQETKEDGTLNSFGGSKEVSFAFPITAKFPHAKLSAKARVSFWWECVKMYRPDAYKPGKRLTKYESTALADMFPFTDSDSLPTRRMLELMVRDWDTVSTKAKAEKWISTPPKHPTPTWIQKNAAHCWDYFEDAAHPPH